MQVSGQFHDRRTKYQEKHSDMKENVECRKVLGKKGHIKLFNNYD